MLAPPAPKIHDAFSQFLHSANIHNFFLFSTPDSFVQLSLFIVFCSAQDFLIPVAETFSGYLLPLTWSSMETSVPNVLSVFHFWVNVSPYSLILYLVSRLPEALPVSVLEEPAAANSCQEHNTSFSILVFNYIQFFHLLSASTHTCYP